MPPNRSMVLPSFNMFDPVAVVKTAFIVGKQPSERLFRGCGSLGSTPAASTIRNPGQNSGPTRVLPVVRGGSAKVGG